MLLFLSISGWLQAPVLLLLGFTALSATPVMLAMVQESLPNHRAVGNGLFMVISFALRPISTLAVGALGDRFGLHTAFVWSAWVSLLAVPAILALPRHPKIAS
jgi:FSR family fosmidomycin resistance protein-like MFS transporter